MILDFRFCRIGELTYRFRPRQKLSGAAWRLFALAVATAAVATARAQVWQKYLAPGLAYRMEVDSSLPRTIHALHFDLKSDVLTSRAELGQLKVYNDDATKGRDTISDLVRKTGAIAGINANYFPYTGRPIGLMVRDGELISSSMNERPDFAWGPGGVTAFAFTKFSASVEIDNGDPVEFDSVNDEAKPDWLCLDTESAGFAFTKQGTGSCAVVKVQGSSFTANCEVDGVVDHIADGVSKLGIPKGFAVLMGTGSKEQIVDGLKPGDRVKLTVKTDGFDWSKIANCVCGGPVLVRHGQEVLDWKQEGFTPGFSLKRYARSAVGVDDKGGMWLVAVDGLQSQSVGATLEEMAAIMMRLGCVDAINLDGGGSTTLSLFGVTVNRPCDGVERPVANAILFFGPGETHESTHFTMRDPGKLTVGSHVQLDVLKADGEPVPQSEILWGASGAGWVDQGGRLTLDKGGALNVSAYVHGQMLGATWHVDAP